MTSVNSKVGYHLALYEMIRLIRGLAADKSFSFGLSTSLSFDSIFLI